MKFFNQKILRFVLGTMLFFMVPHYAFTASKCLPYLFFKNQSSQAAYVSQQNIPIQHGNDAGDTMVLSPDGKYVLTPLRASSAMSVLAVIEIKTGKIAQEIKLRLDSRVEQLIFSPKGNWLFANRSGIGGSSLTSIKNLKAGDFKRYTDNDFTSLLDGYSHIYFSADEKSIYAISSINSESPPVLSVFVNNGKKWAFDKDYALDFSTLADSIITNKFMGSALPNKALISPDHSTLYFSADSENGKNTYTFAIDLKTKKITASYSGELDAISDDGKIIRTLDIRGQRQSFNTLNRKPIAKAAQNLFTTDLNVTDYHQNIFEQYSKDGRYKLEFIRRKGLFLYEIKRNSEKLLKDLGTNIDVDSISAFGFSPEGTILIRQENQLTVIHQ